MIEATTDQIRERSFLNYGALWDLAKVSPPPVSRVEEILRKALDFQGLPLEDAAALLAIQAQEQQERVLEVASRVKEEIYGQRMVLFAPLYTGNHCHNECQYCGFTKSNTALLRRCLSQREIEEQTRALLREGHKRLLLLSGESYPFAYLKESLATIYATREREASIRRINVEVAPLRIREFQELKDCQIGTYACFQETYDPEVYKRYHLSGPKADYLNRLYVMHRAMEGGIDDVGMGVLFGLGDYRFDTLALLSHARELEKHFGCGPHTLSVPRIEPAEGAPISVAVPQPVDDQAFRMIIAVLRITLPYTGIILSTRETSQLRQELFRYGVSQISAGSRTSIGGYGEEEEKNSQFSLGDHRSIEEVISDMIDGGYIPSFCTGCYRQGRVGQDFMDLAKPGLIKHYCQPNGLVSFAEYLLDYPSKATRHKGFALIEKIIAKESPSLVEQIRGSIQELHQGKRDLYI